jgi:hypothetical protein
VTLIDWDYPTVRYPLEELETLEEHAYLNRISELRNVFFAGYGRQMSRPLLHLHRIIGCLGVFGSTEWSNLAADARIAPDQRSLIRSWDTRLKLWIDRLEEHLTLTWTPAPVTHVLNRLRNVCKHRRLPLLAATLAREGGR